MKKMTDRIIGEAALLGIAFIPWLLIFVPAFVDMYLRSH